MARMTRLIKRVYHPYQIWEDYINGMFNHMDPSITPELVDKAEILLSTPTNLYGTMTEVSIRWKYAAELNLTNYGCNRRAWLGQAACCYAHGTPECLTKMAWHRLNNNQQIIANGIADKVISEWETKYISKNRSDYAQKRFEY